MATPAWNQLTSEGGLQLQPARTAVTQVGDQEQRPSGQSPAEVKDPLQRCCAPAQLALGVLFPDVYPAHWDPSYTRTSPSCACSTLPGSSRGSMVV